MMTQQASLRPSPVPVSDSAIGRMDFGYHWIWTYGHLVPLAAFSLVTIVSVLLNGPLWLTASAAVCALWLAAGFWVMRFVVNMNQLGSLPTRLFAQGETRVLDLGCGAGRTSIMVARECPRLNVVALDNFSAGYIASRQDGDDPETYSVHGEANTRANFIAAGVSDRIEITSGDMRQLPFADADFDGVVSSTAIDHLDRADIPVDLAEANRVLKEQGQILLWLAVPNLWSFIAFGPLFALHGTNADLGDWRGMLDEAGFACSLTSCCNLSGASPDDGRFPVRPSSLTLTGRWRHVPVQARVTKLCGGEVKSWRLFLVVASQESEVNTWAAA